MLIQPYSLLWNAHFEAIKKELDQGLQGLDYTIEHVGSTAVPSLAAKPIIDIDIVFKDPAEFLPIKTALESLGYFHNGNQGIEEREVFIRAGNAQHEILDSIAHHLYVCSARNQIESNQSTNNMEVHHHAHHDHGKKTWKSYFWEFFMLFLAVFCGFLAEIQVEHYVEHQKEKKYMTDLVDDIKSDTGFIHFELARMKQQLKGYDSLTANLNSPNLKNEIPDLYRQLNTYSALLTPFLRDQTITQLRSSGNLRLIKKDSIIKQINQYWAWRDVINKISERTEQRILEGLQLSSKIFDRWATDSSAILSNNYAESPLETTPNVVYPSNLKLLSYDMNLIKQYSNFRINISQSARVYLWALIQMEKDGLKLKETIIDEYHIN